MINLRNFLYMIKVGELRILYFSERITCLKVDLLMLGD